MLLLAAVLFLPGLQVLFAVADLNLRQLVSIVALAVIPTVVIQAGKMSGRRWHKKSPCNPFFREV